MQVQKGLVFDLDLAVVNALPCLGSAKSVKEVAKSWFVLAGMEYGCVAAWVLMPVVAAVELAPLVAPHLVQIAEMVDLEGLQAAAAAHTWDFVAELRFGFVRA